MESEQTVLPLPLPAPNATVLPYATPNAPLEYASFGQRLGAWLIDVMLLAGIRFVLVMILGVIFMGVEAMGWETEIVKFIGGLSVILILYLAGWAYYAFMEASKRQATVGKLAMELQVEDVDGGPATFVQVSMRYFTRLLSALLLGVGFLMPMFTAKCQALHDIAANCVVTRRKAPVQFRG